MKSFPEKGQEILLHNPGYSEKKIKYNPILGTWQI